MAIEENRGDRTRPVSSTWSGGCGYQGARPNKPGVAVDSPVRPGLSGQDSSTSPYSRACPRAFRSRTYGGVVPGSSEIPRGVELSRILSAGLRAADAAGVRRVTLEHLLEADFAKLCDETLEFLHEQPSSPSPMPEHRMVSARAAGVMPFWAAALGIVDDEEQRTRLRTLRMAVYDDLDAKPRRGLSRNPGRACPCTSHPGERPGRTGSRTRWPRAAPASAQRS